MGDFSMEDAVEKIYDTKTKDYFNEVLHCYFAGSYRSALVMLYTVVVCDLVYKLKELIELYDDNTSKSILKEIGELQTNSPTSPDWEKFLVDSIKSRTKLLEASDYQNIINLQKHRNLCAHPILDQNYVLYNPNKETAKAHKINILDGILTKPPILSKKIINEFVEDLASKKDILVDDDALRRYLYAKYLRNLIPEVENSLFRSLWKFVFKSVDVNCDDNRVINFRSLKLLFARRKSEYKELIRNEKAYYSSITPGIPTQFLIGLLKDEPNVFVLLEDNAKVLITAESENDIKLFCYAWFLSSDISEHIQKIREKICQSEVKIYKSEIDNLLEISDEFGKKEEVISLLAFYYGCSYDYDEADRRYELLRPYLNKLSDNDLIELIGAIDKNPQVLNRRNGPSTSREIKGICDDVLGCDFDYSEYYSFKYCLKK